MRGTEGAFFKRFGTTLMLVGLVVAASAQTDWRTWEAKADAHWAATNSGYLYLNQGVLGNDRITNEFPYGIEYLIRKSKMDSSVAPLQVAVDQTQKALATLDRSYRGRLGWATSRYSQSLTSHGLFDSFIPVTRKLIYSDTFDTAGTNLLPPNWIRTQATTATCFWNAAGGNGGAGIVQQTDGINWTGLELRRTDLIPGHSYVCTVDGISASSEVNPAIDVRVAGAFQPVTVVQPFVATNRSWQTTSVSFNVPLVGGETIIRLHPSSYAVLTQVKYDNFKLEELVGSIPTGWFANPTVASQFANDAGTFKITSDGTHQIQAVNDLIDSAVSSNPLYTPGATYLLRVESRTSGAIATAKVVDLTSGRTLATVSNASASWSTSTQLFVAPAVPGHRLQVVLSPGTSATAGASVWFRRATVDMRASHLIDDCQTLSAILDLASVIKADPVANSLYGSQAQGWITQAAQITATWDIDRRHVPATSSTPAYGYFRLGDDASSGFPRATVPINYMSAAGSVYTQLYKLTGDSQWRLLATDMANEFRTVLIVHPGTIGGLPTWSWNYQSEIGAASVPPALTLLGRPDDTSHSNLTVGFVKRGASISDGAFSRNDEQILEAMGSGLAVPSNDLPPLWDWISVWDSGEPIHPLQTAWVARSMAP